LCEPGVPNFFSREGRREATLIGKWRKWQAPLGEGRESVGPFKKGGLKKGR